VRPLVVAAGDGAKALEVVEQALNAISSAVEATIEASAIAFSRRVAADDNLHATTTNVAAEGVGVVAGVADQCATLSVYQQFIGRRHVVAIARGERYVKRTAFPIGDDVDFRREASSTTTQTVCLDPPFPPAASWWARIELPSTMDPDLSTRTRSAL